MQNSSLFAPQSDLNGDPFVGHYVGLRHGVVLQSWSGQGERDGRMGRSGKNVCAARGMMENTCQGKAETHVK